MSDTATSSTLLRRMRTTPLRDLLRGRLSGRLDWRATIGASPLPPAVRECVATVVRRTRLWRAEKVEVAEELLAHFVDGIGEGVSAEELVRSFGDVRGAAKLIRRGKIRNRPWAWHLLRWFRAAAALLLVFYAGLAVYFFAGRPTPSVDYIARLNAVIERTPIDQRAWPIYRDALVSTPGLMTCPAYTDERNGRHWPEMAAWLKNHSALLADIRRGAALPALGWVLGPNGSGNDSAVFPAIAGLKVEKSDAGIAFSALLPYLTPLRALAVLVADDAKLAMEQQDANRFLIDVQSLLGIADQLHRADFEVIQDLVAIGLRSMASDTVAQSLVHSPTLLSDAQLRQLAGEIAPPQVAADYLSVRGERLGFEDFVQRVYTDNGRGSGRVTWKGLHLLSNPTGAKPADPDDAGKRLAELLTPAATLVTASRAELLGRYNALLDEIEGELHQPLRLATPGPVQRELQQRQSVMDTVHLMFLLTTAPTLEHLAVAPERVLGQRDGLLVGIALERYRRIHGNYPAGLAELVPGYLGSVPADRITGEPVKYRLIAGKPVVYSVGGDRVDDGGRAAVRDGEPDGLRAAYWTAQPTPVHGDWILYPPTDRAPRDED